MRGLLAAGAALLPLPAAAHASDPPRSLNTVNLREIGLGNGAAQAATDCVTFVCEVAWSDRVAPYAVHARRVDTAPVKAGHTMTFGPELNLPAPAAPVAGRVPRVTYVTRPGALKGRLLSYSAVPID